MEINNMNQQTKQILKDVFTSPLARKVYTFSLGVVLGLIIRGNPEKIKFEEREDNALMKFHVEYLDPATNQRVTAENFNPATFNREYFDPTTFPTINWTNHSNQKVGELFGEMIAKEMACGIDSINYHLTTPGKKYGLDYNYCNKSATTAIVDAAQRAGLKKKGGIEVFAVKQGKHDALYNGDKLVEYFSKQYGDVPGIIIENPSIEDFDNIKTGAIVRFPNHTKVYMGRGFVDQSGRVFIPDHRGNHVIASGYNDSFAYFNGGQCTVIDMANLVATKLQQKGRHTR